MTIATFAHFVQYGPSWSSREAALDALEDYYATGEFSFEEPVRIECRGRRFVILVVEG